MNRVLYQIFALFSWFSVLTFFPALAWAEPADKNIVSRTTATRKLRACGDRSSHSWRKSLP